MNRESQAFILLPRYGLRAGHEDPARPLLDSLPTTKTRDGPTIGRIEVGEGIPVEIIDSADQHGPRLVQLNDWSQDQIRLRAPELRLAPLVEYRRAMVRGQLQPESGQSSQRGAWIVTVRGPNGAGVADVRIVAISGNGDWRDEAISDSEGVARLAPPPTLGPVLTLLAQPLTSFWGVHRTRVSSQDPINLTLTPVDPGYVDALRFYYDGSAFDPSQGVKIGVIDDGVDEHQDLEIAGGQNTVIGEQDCDFSGADRQGHGTHVAGIIAASAHRPMGLQGVAPGASIRSYRVFPGDGWLATNYSIVKALMAAQIGGCDIVNLSLETSEEDQVVADAVEDAREHGMAVVAAAGNGGQAVTQPGSCPGAIAVAALGREGTFPAGSSAASHMSDRRGSDPAEFVAAFSNSGDVTCIAPGVGIVSTLPGNTYGPRSGTSMATPVVTGVVASLLSRSPALMSMARCRARARAIERLLAATAKPSGFGPQYEGLGLPRS